MGLSEIPYEILVLLGFRTGRPGTGVPLESLNNGGTAPSNEASMSLTAMAGTSVPCNASQNYDSRESKSTGGGKVDIVDVDPSAHGNWTIENAKSKLHQFLQINNIKAEYVYSVLLVEGCRHFVAELNIYIERLNCSLTGRESGPNKMYASKKCALSIIHQLYHLGAINAFNGSLKVPREKGNDMLPYTVGISSELQNQILDVLNDLKITPVQVDAAQESEEPISLVNTTVVDDYVPTINPPNEVLPWSPPSADWNPWLSSNIYQDPLGEIGLDNLSKILEEELRKRMQEETFLKKVEDRKHYPIAQCEKEIMNIINENSVCLIRGSTGCGKSTQVAQFILDDRIQSQHGAYCSIIVTQPRRMTVTAIAHRVAFQRGEELGESVGYSVPFESVYPRPHGSILYCTIGTLITKLGNGLQGISHVIIDEVHERTMETDLILIILRDMVNTYPDLRVILMSASIDTTQLSSYFFDCPVVGIPNRNFPVQEYFLEDIIDLVRLYKPQDPKKRRRNRNSERSMHEEETEDFTVDDAEENLNLKIDPTYSSDTKYSLSLLRENEISFPVICEILKYIKNLDTKGAILIFLPGWRAIFSLMHYLQQSRHFGSNDYIILPLHSYLSTEDQRRVFAVYPPTVTKIILTTDIAESSVTINDVVYVIDSCKTGSKIYTSSGSVLKFSTVWVSKSNLQQRKEKAGCIRPGICFFLCSKARYEALEANVTPEILRSPLNDLVLSLKRLRLEPVRYFLSKAIEPPPEDAIREAELFLREMRYLNDENEITPLGQMINQLPIEPRLARMLILGVLFNCANPLATIVANTTTFSSLFLNVNQGEEVNCLQKGFSGIRYSDHVAIINAFQTWESAKETGTEAELCNSKMLSETALKVTEDVKYQLISLLRNYFGFPEKALGDQILNYYGSDPNLDMIIALLSAGFYPNIAYHVTKRKLLTIDNKVALVSRKSVNCSNQDMSFPYPFFVYGEKVTMKSVTCKQITMVTPLSLLLFGARKIEYYKGLVKLDGWLKLKMDPSVASSIVALRPALEYLINRAARQPSEIMNLSPVDEKILVVIRELCKYNAGRCGIPTANIQSNRPQDDIYTPPTKKQKFHDECRGGDPSLKVGYNNGQEKYGSPFGL